MGRTPDQESGCYDSCVGRKTTEFIAGNPKFFLTMYFGITAQIALIVYSL
jgi:hypothetical protein